MHWDKEVTQQLMQQGLTREQAGFVVGIIADRQQIADLQGYTRGYNDGYAQGGKDSVVYG
jgi:hypothetical protein